MMPVLLRLIALAIVGILVMRWLQRKTPDEVVTDAPKRDPAKPPDLWQSLNDFYQHQDRELELAKHWSDDEVALAIEQYVFKLEHSSDDANDLLRKLAQQPETTQQILLQIVADPDMQTRLRKEPRGEPAIYRACQLLMQQPSPRAKPYVERLLTASNEAVRQDATYFPQNRKSVAARSAASFADHAP